MKSPCLPDKDVKHTSVDACKVITRATELFIESLVEGSFIAMKTSKRKTVGAGRASDSASHDGFIHSRNFYSIYGGVTLGVCARWWILLLLLLLLMQFTRGGGFEKKRGCV